MESLALTAFLGGFSGVWFALFLLIFVGCGIFSAENDSFFMGTLTFIVGLGLMQLLFGVPVWATITGNPFAIVLFLAIYIGAGAAYTGLWRWVRFIKERGRDIERSYESWAHIRQRDKQSDDFELFLNSDSYDYKAASHKDKLAAWVLTWPFGLLWDLMHRPARWIFNTVYDNLGVMFETISKNTARKIHGSRLNAKE
jgi:hypothetical protein